ncbi:MAG: DUF2256 domain-containing protein [Solirubrobacterales bacterium]|nr:DUF2256 domain-containing protein [Solirubrobacterales bacterium]
MAERGKGERDGALASTHVEDPLRRGSHPGEDPRLLDDAFVDKEYADAARAVLDRHRWVEPHPRLRRVPVGPVGPVERGGDRRGQRRERPPRLAPLQLEEAEPRQLRAGQAVEILEPIVHGDRRTAEPVGDEAVEPEHALVQHGAGGTAGEAAETFAKHPGSQPRRTPEVRKKGDLPTKICATCGHPFAWRKKWARSWDEVRYCSGRCRRARSVISGDVLQA